MDLKQGLNPIHGQLVIGQWLNGSLNRNNDCHLRSVRVRKIRKTYLIGAEFFAEMLVRRDQLVGHV